MATRRRWVGNESPAMQLLLRSSNADRSPSGYSYVMTKVLETHKKTSDFELNITRKKMI